METNGLRAILYRRTGLCASITTAAVFVEARSGKIATMTEMTKNFYEEFVILRRTFHYLLIERNIPINVWAMFHKSILKKLF